MKVILIIIGLINALYLLSIHVSSQLTCAIGDGCNTVLSSSYASIFGVPIAALGVSLYLVLFLINLLEKKGELSSSHSNALNMLLLTPAAAAGVVLFAVQFIYIQSFCPFCSLNSLLLLILFSTSYSGYLKNKTLQVHLNIAQSVAIIAVFLLPIFYVFSSKPTQQNIIGVIAGEVLTENKFNQSDYSADWNALKQQEYNLKKQLFNTTILELHAKANGQTIKQYVDKVVVPTIKVSEQEIIDFYEKRKNDIPKNQTFEQIKPRIEMYLKRNKEYSAVNDHIKTLYNQYDAELLAIKASPTRISQNHIRSFTSGKKTAPVHIVEFSDLECGHCKTAFVEMKKVLEAFKDDVYFEYRHLPLPHHPFSKQFSIASVCAGDQNQFFEFIELSFANQKNFSKIKPVELAEKLNLDIDTFNRCLVSPVASQVIDVDISEADRLKVKATPTFYINGHYFSGIPSVEDIKSFL